jgi:RED-like protein N-terminal region
MNNEQFRRLLLVNTAQNGSTDTESPSTARSQSGTLGSKQKSSIPMAPRNIKGAVPLSYSRQHSSNNTSQRTSKQFKSIAPKGTKLGSGYRDRTQDRQDDDEDDKLKRLKALEELLKEGEIEEQDFVRMRDEITGGELENTHLVKGLDWKLLERIRRGEDLSARPESNSALPGNEDVDEEFEVLEKHEVKAVQREEKEKKGILTVAPVAGKKRTRDEILAELKASRKKATDLNAAPQLGSKFRKIGESQHTNSPTKAGKTKPKTKRDKSQETISQDTIPQTVPLDHDVVIPKQQAPVQDEESDDDIYAGIGDSYNPLGDMEDDDSEGESGETKQPKSESASNPKAEPQPQPQLQPRTYFNDESTSVLNKVTNPLHDPNILAALAQRTQTQNPESTATDTVRLDEGEERLKRRAAMLAAKDRDLDDLDMGFGSSRFDDAEEMAMEESKIKLSEWKGRNRNDDDDEDDEDYGGKKGKKRKPKKRKGDKNSMADVMRVMESRKN